MIVLDLVEQLVDDALHGVLQSRLVRHVVALPRARLTSHTKVTNSEESQESPGTPEGNNPLGIRISSSSGETFQTKGDKLRWILVYTYTRAHAHTHARTS